MDSDGHQWISGSDWLHPVRTPPTPTLQGSRLTNPVGAKAPVDDDQAEEPRQLGQSVHGDHLADPYDDDAAFARDATIHDLFRHDDEIDPFSIGRRPLEGLVNRFGAIPWPAFAALAAVVALGAVAQIFLFSDSGSGDLAAIGEQSRTTTSTTAGQPGSASEPGSDTVRTGPAPPSLSAAAAADLSQDEVTATNAADTNEAADTGDTGDTEGSAATDTGATGASPGTAPGVAGTDGAAAGSAAGGPVSTDYTSNLEMIRNQTIRNRNEDDSKFRQTPSNQLVPENHYGPRSDYLVTVDGNVEPSFPVEAGGQFRVACEFSHFAYDDPLVYPNQPGASHLHMFFGNTDTNAFSTADSIRNTGGGTCNGSELNRTGYWVPAMFDGKGDVRIPERVVIYYKGEGLARGKAEVFPEKAAMIASVDLNTIAAAQGGAAGKFSYNCANNYSGIDSNLSNTMPVCDGDDYFNLYGVRDPYTVLEVNVKFPQCWNGKDPANPGNFRHPAYASWYGSVCDGEFNHTLVNLEYFVNYRIEPGETTEGWFLSSDVSPTERVLAQTPGSTNHGDWWGGWHKETNKMFIDNCVNYATSAPSGCGFGYLTDGGPNNESPKPGPALKLRDQYLGPLKVSATALHTELCPNGGTLSTPTGAAFCSPAAAVGRTSAPNGEPPAHSPNALFCPVHRGMLASNPASPLSGT